MYTKLLSNEPQIALLESYCKNAQIALFPKERLFTPYGLIFKDRHTTNMFLLT